MTFLPERAICAEQDFVAEFYSSPRMSFPSKTKHGSVFGIPENRSRARHF